MYKTTSASQEAAALPCSTSIPAITGVYRGKFTFQSFSNASVLRGFISGSKLASRGVALHQSESLSAVSQASRGGMNLLSFRVTSCQA